MLMKTLALAAALSFAVTGAAFAQTSGGSAQGNMNNPGSVKSPSQKRMGGQRGMMRMKHRRRHHMRRSRM